MIICLATNNPNKLSELREALSPLGYEIKSHADLGVTSEPEETGATFYENALIKARATMEATGLASLADDSGICAAALGGKPGVHSARYGGFKTDRERNAHLLRQMENEANRTIKFVCALVLCLPDGRELSCEGSCEGVLLTEGRGENGFGYDPLFYYPPMNMTIAEMTGEQKLGISHRGAAISRLRELLELEL